MFLKKLFKDDQELGKPHESVVIDLGSNSFHLIIARIVNDTPHVIDRLKQRICLAEGLDNSNQLSEEAINRGLQCLALFAERLQGYSTSTLRIVATHTLRNAVNSGEFLQRASQILPYPIEIISGQEEARLIYLGAAYTQPQDGKHLVIDIGGGSTELIIGEHLSALHCESRPMGCINFTQRFFPNQVISKSQFRLAQLTSEQYIEDIRQLYKDIGWLSSLGSSGTIKTISAVLSAIEDTGGVIYIKELQKLTDIVLSYKHFNDLDFTGLTEERKPIFVAGLAILSGIMNALEIEQIQLSKGALREGILYEMNSTPSAFHDICSQTVNNLISEYHIDAEQSERVYKTTQYLYSQWKAKNQDLVAPQLEPLLYWAAKLHEIGLSINYNNLHRHSSYILQHSDLIGFNQEYQLVLATLVRFHRKSIKLNALPQFHLFKKRQLLPLIQILRLAILLNKSRQATVNPKSVVLTSNDYHISLIFPKQFLEQNSLIQLDLNREQANWQEVPGWQLFIDEPIKNDAES